jgi:hypothetical protein
MIKTFEVCCLSTQAHTSLNLLHKKDWMIIIFEDLISSAKSVMHGNIEDAALDLAVMFLKGVLTVRQSMCLVFKNFPFL